MNKSLLIGAVLGVAAATAVSVFAGYKLLQEDEPTAVAQVAPVDNAARTECTPSAEEPRDKNRIAGTVVGALVGGAVGNDVGDRDITTAAGAAAGALAGNQIQKKIQEDRAEHHRC
jgi:uncharacterized protein YcfJ